MSGDLALRAASPFVALLALTVLAAWAWRTVAGSLEAVRSIDRLEGMHFDR
jgi:hypothetical protein